jgi:hypothetical protein
MLNPKHPQSVIPHPGVAPGIGPRFGAGDPIDFDDQPDRGAEEAGDEWADRHLSPELEATDLTPSQCEPKQSFRFCRLAAHGTGEFEQSGRAVPSP